MLDDHLLVDAHVHVPVLGTLAPAWLQWARDFGPEGILEDVWDTEGRPRPERLDALFAEQGVDAALLFCEYSPKATGCSPSTTCCRSSSTTRTGSARSPTSTRTCTSRSPTRSLDSSTSAPPLSSCTRCTAGSDATTARSTRRTRCSPSAACPLVVHCGTSSFPGSMNELADPEFLLPVVRDFPDVDVVLAHGGRGWWYDAAAFMALSQPARVDRAVRAAAEAAAGVLRRATTSPGWPAAGSSAPTGPACRAPRERPRRRRPGPRRRRRPGVLGGNALRVYAGLGHLDAGRRTRSTTPTRRRDQPR